VLVPQTSKLAKALHCQLAVGYIRVNAEMTTGMFTGDELEEGLVKSGDRLAVNGIGSRHQNSSKPADKTLNIYTFTGRILPEIE
jgi:hypothetical protein